MRFQPWELVNTAFLAMCALQLFACSVEDEDCRDFGCTGAHTCEEVSIGKFECVNIFVSGPESAGAIMPPISTPSAGGTTANTSTGGGVGPSVPEPTMAIDSGVASNEGRPR